MFCYKKYCLTTTLFLWIIISAVNGLSPPFSPCSASSPQLEQCLTSQGQDSIPSLLHGIPEIGTEPLEMFKIDDYQQKFPSLNFNLSDIIINGKNAKVIRLFIDMEKKKTFLTLDANGEVHSNYNLNGRILIFPLVGSGKSHVYLKDARFEFEFDFEIVKGKDDKERFKFVKLESNVTPTSIEFDLENLFSGNEALNDAVKRVMNENWRTLYTEFASSFVKSMLKKYKKVVAKYWSYWPIDTILKP